VSTKKGKTGHKVESVFIGGQDLFQPPESVWDDLDDIPSYSKTLIERLNGNLSRELVVLSAC
jgi:hypothetical protein